MFPQKKPLISVSTLMSCIVPSYLCRLRWYFEEFLYKVWSYNKAQLTHHVQEMVFCSNQRRSFAQVCCFPRNFKSSNQRKEALTPGNFESGCASAVIMGDVNVFETRLFSWFLQTYTTKTISIRNGRRGIRASAFQKRLASLLSSIKASKV